MTDSPQCKLFLVTAGLVLTVTAVWSAGVAAQQSPDFDKSVPQKAIQDSSRAFTEAFNKGDAAAIAALWMEDAEYVNELGEAFHGRAVIQKEYETFFAQYPGAKMAVQIDSVQVVGSHTAIEDGHSSMGDGGEQMVPTARYTAVHTLHNGTWRLASVRDSVVEADPSYGHVADLDFLVGHWTASHEDVNLDMTCRWIAGGSFLERAWESSRGDAVVSSGTQIIGWDPTGDQLTSWTFTAEGGHDIGVWTPHENGWSVESSGVLFDGTPTSASGHFLSDNENKLSWTSTNRMVGDVQIRDTAEVLLKRTK